MSDVLIVDIDEQTATLVVTSQSDDDSLKVTSSDDMAFGLGAPAGPAGPAATIQVKAHSLVAGATPTASVSGADGVYTIDIGVPVGADGAPIELQSLSDRFQWRVHGAASWNDLILFSTFLNPILTTVAGHVNGLATLDGDGKVPLTQIPALAGGQIFRATARSYFMARSI